MSKILDLLRRDFTLKFLGDRPEFEVWHRLYCNHRYMEAEVFAGCLHIIGRELDDEDFAMCMWTFWSLRNPKALLKNAAPSYIDCESKAIAHRLNTILVDVLDPDTWEKIDFSDSRFIEAMTLPGVRFLIEVSLPCWFLYKEPIQVLYRRARRGNVKALDNILRLDKSLIHDERIRRHIVESAFSSKSLFRKLVAAYRQPIKKRSRAKTKKFMAAHITRVLHGWASATDRFREKYPDLMDEIKKPDVPEVRELFDIEARKQGKLQDPDLPESDEAFPMIALSCASNSSLGVSVLKNSVAIRGKICREILRASGRTGSKSGYAS